MSKLLAAALLLVMGYVVACAMLTAADKEAEIRERNRVADRVQDCGPEYQREYEAAVARIGTMNGFCIVHEPDCSVRVERIF